MMKKVKMEEYKELMREDQKAILRIVQMKLMIIK
jgi:hypothetical protein